MRAAMEVSLKEVRGERCDGSTSGNANVWADKEKNIAQFSYDADEEAEKWWREKGERTVGNMGVSSKM